MCPMCSAPSERDLRICVSFELMQMRNVFVLCVLFFLRAFWGVWSFFDLGLKWNRFDVHLLRFIFSLSYSANEWSTQCVTNNFIKCKLTIRHNADRSMYTVKTTIGLVGWFIFCVRRFCCCLIQTSVSFRAQHNFIEFNCLALFSDVYLHSVSVIIFCNLKTECGQLMSATNCIFRIDSAGSMCTRCVVAVLVVPCRCVSFPLLVTLFFARV